MKVKETQTTIRKKQISFEGDKPKLLLEEVVIGNILVQGNELELIHSNPHKFETNSSWRFFKTLSRKGADKIREKIYRAYVDGNYLHGIKADEYFDYTNGNSDINQRVIYEVYDEKLNEAGIEA